MTECESKATPMIENQDYLPEPAGESKINATEYRSIIGSLIYIMTGTRPDISFAVSKLAQFMTKPFTSHMTALKRVLRYLKGTKHFKFIIDGKKTKNGALVVFADADWGGDKHDRKSMTGYILKYNENVIAWKTKKQNVVALSSTESELYSITLILFCGIFSISSTN
jgi:hypothetical protein